MSAQKSKIGDKTFFNTKWVSINLTLGRLLGQKKLGKKVGGIK
jgi:hypothetical protein